MIPIYVWFMKKGATKGLIVHKFRLINEIN